MSINLAVRFKNPTFWVNVILAVFVPVLAYFGLNWQDMTTWQSIFALLWEAVQNPVVVVSVIVSVWNALHDPTTKTFSDSESAMTYTEPK